MTIITIAGIRYRIIEEGIVTTEGKSLVDGKEIKFEYQYNAVRVEKI